MTVMEYERLFTQLSRFAKDMIPTEERRKKRFLAGLNASLREALLPFNFSSYFKLVTKAELLADEKERNRNARDQRFALRNGGVHKPSQNRNPGNKNRPYGRPGQSKWKSRPPTTHSGNDTPSGGQGRPPPTCFTCGKTGHFANQCWSGESRGPGQTGRTAPPTYPHGSARPQGANQSQQGYATKGKEPIGGRVYAMTQGQAQKSSGTVTGTLILCNHRARTLFDSGSTHTFASRRFLDLCGIICDKCTCPLLISTPVGGSVIVDEVTRGQPLNVNGVEFETDLMPLQMTDFDVIIGMD